MEPGKHALEVPGCRGLEGAAEGTVQAQSGLCAQTLGRLGGAGGPGGLQRDVRGEEEGSTGTISERELSSNWKVKSFMGSEV